MDSRACSVTARSRGSASSISVAMSMVIMPTWLPMDSLLRSALTLMGAPQDRLLAGSSPFACRYLRRPPPTTETMTSFTVAPSTALLSDRTAARSRIMASVTRNALTRWLKRVLPAGDFGGCAVSRSPARRLARIRLGTSLPSVSTNLTGRLRLFR